MSVSVNAASASIVLDKAAARPNVAIQQNRAICHLTHGFDPNEVFDPTQPNKSKVAWTGTGRFKIVKGPADKLDFWNFGFIQFQTTTAYSFFFAGKTAGAGAITIHAHKPPAMPRKTELDSVVSQSPWTKAQPRFKLNGLEVECVTGDHPMISSDVSLKNRTTGEENFLFHIVSEREFLTALAVMNDRGTVTYLRHFHWTLKYDFMFNWSNDRPVMVKNGSSIKFGDVENGPPTAAGLGGALPALSAPFANETGKLAVVAAVTGFNPENRIDHAKRFANVPHGFYR